MVRQGSRIPRKPEKRNKQAKLKPVRLTVGTIKKRLAQHRSLARYRIDVNETAAQAFKVTVKNTSGQTLIVSITGRTYSKITPRNNMPAEEEQTVFEYIKQAISQKGMRLS